MSDSQPPVIPPPLLSTAEQPKPISRARWWVHLLIIAAFPIVIGLLSTGRPTNAAPALGRGATRLLVVCAFELILFSIVFGGAWLASRASSKDLYLRWRPGWLAWPLGIGYSIGLRLVIAVMIAVVGAFLVLTGVLTTEGLQKFFSLNRPDVEALIDVKSLKSDPLYFWLSITLVSFIVGGLREELWRAAFMTGCRHLWPNCFGSTVGQLWAVALAAIAFGLGHLAQGILAACLTGLLGMGLGAIIVLHRSIWPAALAHGFFNATSFVLLPLVLDKLPQLR